MGSYVRLLRENHDFRNLWLATMVSYAGDWFNLLASAALVAHLTDSGLAISALFLARFLPSFSLRQSPACWQTVSTASDC